MSPALQAAIEINNRWLNCLRRSHAQLADCPTNEQVAAIIELHINPSKDK